MATYTDCMPHKIAMYILATVASCVSFMLTSIYCISIYAEHAFVGVVAAIVIDATKYAVIIEARRCMYGFAMAAYSTIAVLFLCISLYASVKSMSATDTGTQGVEMSLLLRSAEADLGANRITRANATLKEASELRYSINNDTKTAVEHAARIIIAIAIELAAAVSIIIATRPVQSGTEVDAYAKMADGIRGEGSHIKAVWKVMHEYGCNRKTAEEAVRRLGV